MPIRQIILVLMHGGGLDIYNEQVSDRISAILDVYYPGYHYVTSIHDIISRHDQAVGRRRHRQHIVRRKRPGWAPANHAVQQHGAAEPHH